MAKKATIIAALVLLVASALVGGGYWRMHRQAQQYCGYCQRHIDPRARVVAELGGERRTVCCAHCALSEARQEHKPVKLIEVTDYDSGTRLTPEGAWYVDGSRVVVCTHDAVHTDESKHADHLAFDRCAPGTLAFRSRQAAESFMDKSGGVLHSFDDLMAEVQP